MKLSSKKNNTRPSFYGKDYLDNFYALMIKFLVENKLERQPEGFQNHEIEHYELAKAIKFPKAYRLFLSLMAKSNLRIFDGQDYSLAGLKDAQEVSNELLEQDNYQLEANTFPFTQWQGYNFYYFSLASENPNVKLYIEAGSASVDVPPKVYEYGKFTDWLCKEVENSLNLRNQLNGLEIKDLLKELEKIKKAGNKN